MARLFEPKYETLDQEESSCEVDDWSNHDICQACRRKNASSLIPLLSTAGSWILNTFFFLLFLVGVIVFEFSVRAPEPQWGAFSTELSRVSHLSSIHRILICARYREI